MMIGDHVSIEASHFIQSGDKELQGLRRALRLCPQKRRARLTGVVELFFVVALRENSAMINCMKQLELPVRGRGGRRAGAGPKLKKRGRVEHGPRPAFPGRLPLHVTLRVRRDVPNLREEKRWKEI